MDVVLSDELTPVVADKDNVWYHCIFVREDDINRSKNNFSNVILFEKVLDLIVNLRRKFLMSNRGGRYHIKVTIQQFNKRSIWPLRKVVQISNGKKNLPGLMTRSHFDILKWEG